MINRQAKGLVMNISCIIKTVLCWYILNAGCNLQAMIIEHIDNQSEQNIEVTYHYNSSRAQVIHCPAQTTKPFNKYLSNNKKISTSIQSTATNYIIVKYDKITTACACGNLSFNNLQLCAFWQQQINTEQLKGITRLSDYQEGLCCELIISKNGSLSIRPSN